MTRLPRLPFATQRSTLAGLVAGMGLTIAVYAAGLHGGFLFDDLSFLIGNPAVQLHAPTQWSDWGRAAASFPAEHQGRWLTMLSFALNHYFSGLDPFWLKLSNLVIHLVNGVLLFVLLRALFGLREAIEPWPAPRVPERWAAVLACAWLLLPINVSAVLYVAQRLESLSTSFVLLGLWLYLRARRRHYEGGAAWPMAAALIGCAAVGALAKESAAILPLFAFCSEWALPRGRQRDGTRSRGVIVLFALTLGLPLLMGIVWLASWVGGPSSYARPFSTLQRVLTESRVLVDYAQWTLLPSPHALSFYHDDVALSRSLLQPPSTLLCVLGLAAAAFGAWRARARRPLLFLGVLWFFAGHALTGTVIPLELVFEHRNYFPSVGLLLAAASLAGLETAVPARAYRLLAAIALALYAGVTAQLAREWGDPLRFPLSQMEKRPTSQRAQSELASTLLEYADRAQDPAQGRVLVDEAMKIVRTQLAQPSLTANIIPDQILIMYRNQHHLKVDEADWIDLVSRLQQRAPSESDIGALYGLLACRARQVCADPPQYLLEAYLAALAHPPPKAKLMAAYADFLTTELKDYATAERVIRDAIAILPDETDYRGSLVRLLLVQGKFPEARTALDALRARDRWGLHSGIIATLEQEYAEQSALAAGAAPAPSSTARP